MSSAEQPILIDTELARMASGNWNSWKLPLERIYEAASDWKQVLEGIDKPWLCWNVSSRWCLVQQRLVQHVGWTPVIGYDPRIGPPKEVVPGALVVDFNRRFQFPRLLPLFVMDWVHLFAPRLAYWHSDLLCRLPVVEKLAAIYAKLQDGGMACVRNNAGLRNTFNFKVHRYWDLAGCTTAGAAKSHFETGTGWWRHFEDHPMCTDQAEKARRSSYFYDFGVGIMYWKRSYRGKLVEIPESLVREGHCTSIGNKNYKWSGPSKNAQRSPADIDLNYNIEEVAGRLGISHLLS